MRVAAAEFIFRSVRLRFREFARQLLAFSSRHAAAAAPAKVACRFQGLQQFNTSFRCRKPTASAYYGLLAPPCRRRRS